VLDALLEAVIAWGDQKRPVARQDVLRLARAAAAASGPGSALEDMAHEAAPPETGLGS
jgi:hypothetical protein